MALTFVSVKADSMSRKNKYSSEQLQESSLEESLLVLYRCADIVAISVFHAIAPSRQHSSACVGGARAGGTPPNGKPSIRKV